MRLLLGAENLPVRRLAITWAAVGGWIMGSGFYLTFLRHEAMMLVLGVPVALLSAVAMARATRQTENIPSVIVGYSVLASLLCPFVTLAPLMFFGSGADYPVVFGTVIAGSVVGAFFAAPLGTMFGVIYSWVWRTLAGARKYDRAGEQVLWMRFGIMFIALSGLLVAIDQVLPNPWPISPMFARPAGNVLEWLALGTFVFGATIGIGGLLRYASRVHLAQRVRRGEIEGWAFVPLATIENAEALPRLFAHGAADMVLVRRCDTAAGPFRSSEFVEPVART